jgi:anti-sigma B factor antagonist
MNTTPSADPAHLDTKQFAVETELTERSLRIVVHGELDLATAAAFEGALRSSWSRDVECVEIDLRGLTFIGSAGIAAILAARGRARETGCTLALVRGPDSVHRIFELTGIASRLEFCAAPARGGRGASLRLVR